LWLSGQGLAIFGCGFAIFERHKTVSNQLRTILSGLIWIKVWQFVCKGLASNECNAGKALKNTSTVHGKLPEEKKGT
jgi:hypothetical protein